MITQISKRLHRLNSYDNIYVICFLICVISILISGCAEKSDEDTARIETPELEQKILSFNLANYEEDGSKKWELKGDSANVMTDIIYLANILVDIHEEPQIKLTSDEGSYDRKNRIITLIKNVILTNSDGLKLTTNLVKWDGKTDMISTSWPVKIERSDIVATGLGATAMPQMKKVMLNKNVKVLLLHDVMGGDSLEIKEEKQGKEEQEKFKATITCDGPLEIDYENNIAVFENNVKVNDERGQIYADRMDACMDPISKNILKVIAEGTVKVVRGRDSTYSEKAVYTTADQKIVLLGKPKIFIHADKEIEKMEQDFGKKKKW